jgi:uncharacterized small protein (DUF1192 family)
MHIFTTLLLAFVSSHCANAQVDSLVHAGDSLHRIYRFDDAIDAFDLALELTQDSTPVADSLLMDSISGKLLLSENGSNMARFVRKPKVVGRERFSLDDFVLYYPLEDKSWRQLPNQLDADASDAYVRALYAPDWNVEHYYSAKDESGFRSIFVTELHDTVWTVPRKVVELSSDVANEIYPVLSPDGNTIYFSSDGLYGLGGYDIYYSTWDNDQGSWSMPQNLGIPFSSPGDDFLFVDSEDERYSLFASNRNSPKDSVDVYAIEFERYPVHVTVDEPQELLDLSRLDPPRRKARPDNNVKVQEDDMTLLYMAQMDAVRALKDSISVISSQLDDLRTDLAFSNDDTERYELSAVIIEMEQRVPLLQRELEGAKAELQKTEYEFLKNGVFIKSRVDYEEDSEVEEETKEYHFRRNSYGDSLRLNVEIPQVKFDYTFRILEEAVMAEDQTLPSGIVYQIQFIGGARKMALSELKGMSPVYEHRSPSGMYIYRVGRFSTYDEALSNIYVVRDLGYKSAYLCAFDNGKEISVAKARTAQERLKGGFALYEIRIIPESGELDQPVVEALLSAAVGKDIIRSEGEDGTQVFTVGPFDSKADADAIVETIKVMMSGRVMCEPIMN